MRELALRTASNASIILLPLLITQGLWIRQRIPRLPGAAGSETGVAGNNGAPFKLLVIGESTVAGIGAPTHEAALTGQIAVALSQKLQRTVHWRAVGKNGVTAKKTRTDLLPNVPRESVEMVVIALGVNDVLAFHRAATWVRDLMALIEAIRERVGPAPVALAAVPPVGNFPSLPQPLRGVLGLRARVLDQASRRLAPTLSDVIYADTEFPADPEMFCEDKFHPGPLAYQLWGARIAEIVARLI